jgi:SHS family lactate transporter-like MFS transporter
MADRWGRKLPLMLSLIWFAVFDAAIYFAPTFTWVIIFRTLFGFGMGAEWTAGTSLAMEAFPEKKRNLASGILQAGWPVGFFLSAAVAHFVVPAFGWRAMFLIAAVPAVLVIPIRMLVPDEQGAIDEKRETSKGALSDLLEPRVLRMLILGSLVMALGFIVYYGMVTNHLGLHIEAAHCGKDAKCIGAAVNTGWNNQILFNVGMLVGVVLAGWVAKRWGVIVALVTPALLMVPAMPLFVGMSPNFMWLGALLGGLLGVGYSGVTPVLTTSLFPQHVRARSIGIVYHMGALLAAFVPTFIPWLSKLSHMTLANTVMIVVGGGLVVMSAAILALRGELTKRPVVVPTVSAVVVEPPLRSHAGELHPVATAIVDREVARAAERRAILG